MYPHADPIGENVLRDLYPPPNTEKHGFRVGKAMMAHIPVIDEDGEECCQHVYLVEAMLD